MSHNDSRFKSVKSGFKWLSLASVTGRVVTFGMGICLARFYLSPSQFGLVNMAAICITAVDLIRDVGLVEALLKRDPLDDDSICTAFWLLLGFALTATLLVSVTAPLLAGAFHEPILTPYLRLLSISLILSSITAVPLALLQKSNRWKEYALSDFMVSVVASGSTLTYAICGAGAWSIILGTLTKGFVQIAYTWTVVKWRLRIQFSKQTAKQLLSFGKWITAVRFPDFFLYVTDNIYLGLYAGKQNLGYYSQPYNWISQPMNLFVFQVGKALYPNLASNQSDIERRDLFLKSYRVLCWLVIPLYVYMGVHAQLIVDVVFGPKWHKSGPILAWLCIAAISRALTADGVQGYFWACNRGKSYVWPQWIAIAFLFACMAWSRGTLNGKQIAILFTIGISIRGIINIIMLNTATAPATVRIMRCIVTALIPSVLLSLMSFYISKHISSCDCLQLLISLMTYSITILCCAVMTTSNINSLRRLLPHKIANNDLPK